MDFQLTEEQKGLVALVKDFAKRVVTPAFAKALEAKPAQERIPFLKEQGVLKTMSDLGFRTLTLPKEHGGAGVGMLTELLVCESFTRYCAPLSPAMFLLATWKQSRDIADFGTEDQKEWFFTRLTRDPYFLIGLSGTEPDHGSDSRLPHEGPGSGMKTFAYRDGDQWVINGEKCFQSGAKSDLLFVYLRTRKDLPLSQSMSVILVPTDVPGYSIPKIYEVMHEGMRPICDVRFDNVRVPVGNLLGEENKGWPLLDGRYAFCLSAQAVLLGNAERIYELTKEFARTRVQGGKPIIEHGTIGSLLVDMHMKVEDLRMRLYRTAWEIDQAVKAGRKLISPLTLYASDLAAKETQRLVASHAMEIWGGRGVLKELPIESYLRSVWGHNHEIIPCSVEKIKCSHLLDWDPYLTA